MDGTRSRADFSSVSPEEALNRARELVPFLREQAPKCEVLRRLTPEVMDVLHKKGLFRYMQPKVWGGSELPFVAHYDIPEMLARGASRNPEGTLSRASKRIATRLNGCRS